MTDEVVLRGYRAADLKAMFEMDVACFPEMFRFDLRSMRRFAEARNAIVLLAERKGLRETDSLLGFVIVDVVRGPGARYAYVITLDVRPEDRRGGVAGRLMDEAERRAWEAGARWMALHVHTENEGAVRFYERRGYVQTGVDRGFYGTADGVGVDAYSYRKEPGRTA